MCNPHFIFIFVDCVSQDSNLATRKQDSRNMHKTLYARTVFSRSKPGVKITQTLTEANTSIHRHEFVTSCNYLFTDSYKPLAILRNGVIAVV